jgi:hypothetical protein
MKKSAEVLSADPSVPVMADSRKLFPFPMIFKFTVFGKRGFLL